MTKFVRSLAAVAAVATLASAANAETTVRVAYDADPVSMDPHEQLSGGTLQLSHMVFDPLVRWTKDLQFEARLAESWEQIDDTTMRFKLKNGVKFHSGNMLTAKDVDWTFDRLKASDDFKGIFAPFTDVEVVDDMTFDLKTAEPYPLVLHTATYIFPMDSAFYTGTTDDGKDKSEIVKHGDSFASRNISGTGPFVVSEREQGVKVVFDRFDGYWDTETAGNVDKIILTPIKEDPTRVAALLSGDVDFIAPVPPTDLKRVGDADGVDLITMAGTRIITFQMNQNRVEALKDPKVRLAIDYAVNNAGIVDRIMRGFGTVGAQASPAGYLGHDPAITPRFDLEKAKALMAEAGYADGFSITMMAPNNRYVNDDKIAQAVASMLSQINIKVDLQTMPKAQYWPKFDERAADMMMIGWHADTEDSANFHQFLSACPDEATGNGQYNSGAYCNAEADALMNASNSETDPAKRAEQLQKLENILYDEAAFIPLHWQNLAWGSKSNMNSTDIVNALNFPYFGDLVVQ
ncbi:peptide/nickel transport system substrate-binding protein [Aliiroseovarius halocynthiae]|uniref:ABC transporter substrate-binding protein n=1 Tax=Aliiroseovarius halocynthiae TaxID=985055 RepID=A0A545SQ24_9RHOB|nr:ABC transporter substrate-binding protein [Aliiroseovarius halocynthiae]TQV67071.1 ABC transporter substrate-binding protein [Aliiroseovarius halocynthiae]SMR82207.1 peptide/nickel transport system substrate-binding protein [Aliiroseovarius halocynthiae]